MKSRRSADVVVRMGINSKKSLSSAIRDKHVNVTMSY